MKRTFIYTDEKSNKFWTIEIINNTYVINFGKVGTAGQTQTKEFANEEECQKAANKLIAEKTKKGYVEADKTSIVNTEKPEKKTAKKYLTFTEACEKDDKDKQYPFEVFNVDINDPESVIATLKAFSKKISDEETREDWEGNGSFPPFGKVENGIFYPLESKSDDASEEDDYNNIYNENYFPSAIFYRIAAECEQAREELVKVCKQIIKINYENSGCPTWESEEHLMGASQAFALAMVDKQYIELAGEMMASMYNGDHSTPDSLVVDLIDKWGANNNTLEFGVLYITQMPLQDLYLAQEIFLGFFKDYLKDEKNINRFLKVYAKHVEDSHSDVTDLFKKIFSDLDSEKLTARFLKLIEDKETPTLKKLKEEEKENSEEISASPELFSEKLNKILKELNIAPIPDGKEYSYPRIDGQYMSDGQQQFKFSKQYGYYELGIAGVKTITDKDWENDTKEGKPETIRIANKLNAILPDLKLTVGGSGNIRLNTNTRYKIYDTLSEENIKKQIYAVTGCEDLVTHYLTEINYDRLTPEEALKKIDELQSSNNIQPHDISAFEDKVIQYLSEIKEITILNQDKNNHIICLHYNNPTDGDSVGVIEIHPRINKVSITIPYYQGEFKQNESEISEWCESREGMCVNGLFAFDPESGYVWFRNIVDIDTVTNGKIFVDAIANHLKEDTPYFAPLIKKVAEGEKAKEVIAYEDKKYNEKIARKTKVKIELPEDLRKIGIYPGEGERLLYAFMEYGKDFYNGNIPIKKEEEIEESNYTETNEFSSSENSFDREIAVDPENVSDMKHVLEMLIANIDGISRHASPNDGFIYGKIEDGEFEAFDEETAESEAIFFEHAAQHTELHKLIIKYAEMVDKNQFVDSMSDMRMGMNAVYALASKDEKYIPLFIEHHRKIRPGGGEWQMNHIIDLLSDTNNGLKLLAACCMYVIDQPDIEINLEPWMEEHVGEDSKKQKKVFDYMMQEAAKMTDHEFLVDYVSEALNAMGVEYDEEKLEEILEDIDGEDLPKLKDVM